MATSKAQRAATAARRAKAIQLRLGGANLETIAAELAYSSRAAVSVDLSRALAANVAEMNHSSDLLRQQELDRLDRLQAGVWDAALAGDTQAATTALRIIDRRCKLLGLDAPQRHEVVSMDVVDAEIQRLNAEIAEADRIRLRNAELSGAEAAETAAAAGVATAES